MYAQILSVVAATAALAALPGPNRGTLVTVQGTFEADQGDPADTRKSFELSYLVSDTEENGATLLWTLAEEGHGAWLWPDRFGQVRFAGGPPAEITLPALLYERDSGRSVVPVVGPLFFSPEPLREGLTWTAENLNYEVSGTERIADRPAWVVAARNRFGHKRTLWVDQQSPWILRLAETVFIGQGEQHELRYEVAATREFSQPDIDQTLTGFAVLSQLRDRAGRKPRDEQKEWNTNQLSQLRELLPTVAEKIAIGPLTPILKAAQRDVQEQRGRAGAVAALEEKALGREFTDVELLDGAGRDFDLDRLKGRVTVLHFWEYRDAPLEEPYGQVAYLDFLSRDHDRESLQVLGVNVDPRLRDPETHRAAVASAKKLVAFMNLSYPVLSDSANALGVLGDPREAGARLPLFVVLDREAKVIHYHVGFYDVDRLQGLAELSLVVNKALKSDPSGR